MSDIPSRRPRCSRAEKLRRVDELAEAIASGEEPVRAGKRLLASWGVSSRRNLSRYVSAVFSSWAADRELASAGGLDVALAVRREVLRRALKAGDLGVALKAQDGVDELLGLGRELTTARIEAEMKPGIDRFVQVVGQVLLSELGGDREAVRRVVTRALAAWPPNGSTNGRALPSDR